ncbi:MAG: hypothetical protein IRY98_02070 [Alicyclobacillaceae bacterium]|nr:hypothetical protein [Alicyclobacillaceae bacterium]
MWRQSREYSWIWLVMAGALLLVSHRGRQAAAAWARKAADWLDESGKNTKREEWGARDDRKAGRRERHGPSHIPERGRETARRGGNCAPATEDGGCVQFGSREDRARGAEGQVIWWVTQSAPDADGVSE